LCLPCNGIARPPYTWPAIGMAPRFGAAWDVTGRQRLVLRGGAGLFFDRPSGNSVFDTILNPPTLQQITVRYGQPQTLGSGGLTTTTPPSLNVFEYAAALPSTAQWDGRARIRL